MSEAKTPKSPNQDKPANQVSRFIPLVIELDPKTKETYDQKKDSSQWLEAPKSEFPTNPTGAEYVGSGILPEVSPESSGGEPSIFRERTPLESFDDLERDLRSLESQALAFENSRLKNNETSASESNHLKTYQHPGEPIEKTVQLEPTVVLNTESRVKSGGQPDGIGPLNNQEVQSSSVVDPRAKKPLRRGSLQFQDLIVSEMDAEKALEALQLFLSDPNSNQSSAWIEKFSDTILELGDYRMAIDAGIACQQMGFGWNALKLLERSIHICEWSVMARTLYAETVIDLAKTDPTDLEVQHRAFNALQHLQPLFEDSDLSHDELLLAQYLRGCCLDIVGQRDLAMQTFFEVQKERPSFRDIEFRIRISQSSQGR